MKLNDKFELEAIREPDWGVFHSSFASRNEVLIHIFLDLMEGTMQKTEKDLCLRTRVIRKETGVELISATQLERADYPDVGRSGT